MEPAPTDRPSPLSSIGRTLVAHGLFLAAAGVAGWLSNPEKAKTAVLSGGTFGGLQVLWGVLALRGWARARTAALITTGLLFAVFAWRATATWMAWAGGNDAKQFAAILITGMFASTAIVLWRLLRSGRAG